MKRIIRSKASDEWRTPVDLYRALDAEFTFDVDLAATRWWEWTRFATEIREIPGRVKFLKADGVTAAGAMFPSCVVVFRPQPGILRAQPRRVVWTYREAATT